MRLAAWGFLLAIACGGCASSRGPSQSIEDLPPDEMRLYLLRESKFAAGGAAFPIVIDGDQKILIPNGSYFYVDLKPGEHDLVSAPTMLPGKFRLRVKGEPAHSYHVLIKYRQGNAFLGVAGTMLGISLVGPVGGAMLGWATQSAESGSKGPYQLIPMPEADAEALMKKLKFRGGWPAT